MKIIVAALYKFAELPDYQQLREPLWDLCVENHIKGTLLLAAEGINGTIAGPREGIDRVREYLQQDPRFSGLSYKESEFDSYPFYRMKVKLKKEIVTMGVEGVSPTKKVGEYVKPKDWNDLISDPEVLVVDTRNDYEVQIGTFHNAVNPCTESFRDFPDYVQKNLDKDRYRKVAMFCTGGIRCEKATSYLLEQGFEEVYHLQGGILKYLEEVPPEKSLWQGECFVFDQRVAVTHEVKPGNYHLCHGCRMPIGEKDMRSPYYVKGVSCPNCYQQLSEEKKQRLEQRQKQIELSRQRGEQHLGRTYEIEKEQVK